MFQIIKTGQSKMQELHYVDFGGGRKNASSPPPLVLSSGSYHPSSTIGPGGKRQFVKVNEEMFVNEIRKRPILYNTTLKDYKKFSTRHESWAEVALAMGLSERECKKRWRSLRDAFMKVVRNKNEEERKTWLHYRLLEFLLPYIGNNRTKRSRTVEFIEGFEHDEEDAEYVEVDEDMDIYEGSREPITVSYVTEDGKEVFQMLQDPDTIPEGAFGIEETEEEDEGDEEDVFTEIHHPGQVDDTHESLNVQQEHQTSSFLYEERLDAAMLELQEPYDAIEQKSFTTENMENIKQESLSDAEGSEIHVEEIEMESIISDQQEEEPEESQHHQEPVIETIPPPSIREPTPTENLLESLPAPPCTSVPILDPVPVSQPQSTTPTLPILQELPPLQSQILPPAPQPPSREDSISREPEKPTCNDSDERFLLSCAPIMRRLPNKKNQLARLKIQQLLFELEYDEKYNS